MLREKLRIEKSEQAETRMLEQIAGAYIDNIVFTLNKQAEENRKKRQKEKVEKHRQQLED